MLLCNICIYYTLLCNIYYTTCEDYILTLVFKPFTVFRSFHRLNYFINLNTQFRIYKYYREDAIKVVLSIYIYIYIYIYIVFIH